jgi:hypothetical protein
MGPPHLVLFEHMYRFVQASDLSEAPQQTFRGRLKLCSDAGSLTVCSWNPVKTQVNLWYGITHFQGIPDEYLVGPLPG